MELNINEVKLGVIGCGKMAGAILEGIVKSGFIKPDKIFLYDINENNLNSLACKLNANKKKTIEELLSAVNVILLATKPFVADDVMSEIKKYYKNHLIMSILAGVKLEKYYSYIPKAQIVRIMPNTPALVLEGMSALCKGEYVEDDKYSFAIEFMKNCGKTLKTDEDKIDVITALSGSGPAYYFKIIELMAHSAQKLGLNYDEAILLSAQTALGSAKLVMENNFDTATLIKNVTTPNGCTEVGNRVLEESDIEKIMDKLISDTAKRAKELA